MPILKAFLYFEGADISYVYDARGTYAHRAALWKNGLIFMFLVHRIMTKIYEVIFTAVFLFELVVLLIRRM